MRVTTDMNIRMLSDAIRRHQLTAYRLQEQVASGQKVRLASDDPGAYEMIRKLSSDRNLLHQYDRNADMAMHYLQLAGQGLDQAVNLLHRVNELAVRGGDGTQEATSRSAMAEEVDTLLHALLSVANASEGGRHTFAGLRTDTKPFEAEYHPDTGRIIAVNYIGSEETRTIKTGDSLYVATNLAGATSVGENGIFQTETLDLFDSLIELRDALYDNVNISETNIPDKLQDDLVHLLNVTSLNGAREEQVRLQQTYSKEMQATQLRSLDALQSVDLAKAFMKISEAETAYHAALHSTSTMMKQVSLLNFI